MRQCTHNVLLANAAEADRQALLEVEEFKGVDKIPKEPFNSNLDLTHCCIVPFHLGCQWPVMNWGLELNSVAKGICQVPIMIHTLVGQLEKMHIASGHAKVPSLLVSQYHVCVPLDS